MPKSRKRAKTASAAKGAIPVSRRKLLSSGALASALVVGGGVWGVNSFRRFSDEHDLTRVGNGNPAIVQIHDPQCPTCTALQKEARQALRAFDGCGLTYLVADIKTTEGAAFARRYNSAHVTLLLFDGEGVLKRRIQGLQESAYLESVFAAYKAAVT